MLDLAPRNSAMTSSQRGSFLNKAESIKKLRGLDADIDLEEFEKKAQEKVKKSMAKIVSSMVSQDFHDDLDVEVRIPSVARGKSSELINNATFLRQYIGKESDDAEKPFSAVPLKQTKSVTVGESINSRKEVLSRKDFFRDIQEQTRMKRSKYLSNEEIKNNFKKTNLAELEDIRKKNIEKRRKEALSDD